MITPAARGSITSKKNSPGEIGRTVVGWTKTLGRRGPLKTKLMDEAAHFRL